MARYSRSLPQAEVSLGFLYPFEGGPTITLQERQVTFLAAGSRVLWSVVGNAHAFGPRGTAIGCDGAAFDAARFCTILEERRGVAQSGSAQRLGR